ncbi:MAG TPA: hypothetical protein VMY88_12955 [Acidimicrobiales bacterium]|nr:hypothetical protein [Acidimicrobiales bacterium]
MDNAEAARELRRQGKSTAQIKEALGLSSGGGALSRWLKDIPAPEWTRRPRAKDDVRELAVAMRLEGKSYRQILETLPVAVSKSSLSLWLRDVPLTDDQKRMLAMRQDVARSARAASVRRQRIRRQEATMTAARNQVQHLAESELFVAGLAAYWAEGSKAKPWRSGSERVTFINSDPDMIRLFLAWLALLGISSDRLVFRVSIHERADVEKATRFWSDLVGVRHEEFRRPTLKRHNPKTVRHNVGDGYYGCLTVEVRRSTELYRQIAGWWQGLAAFLGKTAPVSLDSLSGVV